MSCERDWIEEKAATSIHPAQVASTLRSLVESWPNDSRPLCELVEQFSLGENALLHLISVSSIGAARLVREPEILLWLDQPEISSAARTHGEMLAALHAIAGDAVAAENFRALRHWKGREMVRIALREISESAPLEETTAELSQIAEICVNEVFRHWSAELGARRGRPAAQFAILGMGKLGGRELNHSSDIDLMFVYSEEGQLAANFTYHQWFNLLGEKIAETFTAIDPAGTLFRIDLRLRPEGAAGPLARSLESMENYYAGFGETWERLALTKARGICGDRELIYDFFRQHQSFIYPKSPTPDLLEEIAAIKKRIERDIVGEENLERDVKLGAGGIREIEFVVQALQLLHGARNTFLQDPSTLKVLPLLAQLDLLPRREVRLLDNAYRFLRLVEHRLQIEDEQQIHTLPENPRALARLARSLGFSATSDFISSLGKHRREVREIFLRLISEPAPARESAIKHLQIFCDEKAAAKALTDLAQGRSAFHVGPRTRQVLRNLRPLLLQQLGHVPDPDVALNQFVRFVEAYGLRSMLFELLVVNPRLLELLVKTFDASRAAGDLLIRRPQLMEEITRAGMLDRSISVAEHTRRMQSLRKVGSSSFDGVRLYRQTQFLRIFLRDVLGLIDLSTLFAEHSALAEACLLFVRQALSRNGDLTIIGLGKFGGADLSYGADLDVLFVGEGIRTAQNLIVAMAKTTAEGTIYALDARLRPDGEKGTLTCSLATYESYYETRAQLWEVQALTRARPISGLLQKEFLELAKRVWRKAGERPDLHAQINAMLERIRRDRGTGSGALDFKTGTGGIIEAEFLVQALQMRAGMWNASMSGALDDLKRRALLTVSEVEQLQESYLFLRLIESVLRRGENKNVTTLPTDESDQRKLAVRVEAGDLTSFVARYRVARETIHAVYTARICNSG